jgi:hypothetical protein
MGGEIALEATSEKGTIFRVLMPVKTSPRSSMDLRAFFLSS